MKESLLNLIRERTNQVSLAEDLLKKKFGDINFIAAKNAGQIPKRGFLDAAETISYNLHGRGCDVDFGGERIEFDFNFVTSNHTGFNFWWLQAFLNRHQEKFKELADLSIENIQSLLIELERENQIRFDETTNLYFLPEEFNFKTEAKTTNLELALS